MNAFVVGILQEIHKTARQHFKGLFDKKPGEISEDLCEEAPGESHDADDQDALDGDKEHLLEATAPPRSSIWSGLWPGSRKLLTTLGLDRCTIL